MQYVYSYTQYVCTLYTTSIYSAYNDDDVVRMLRDRRYYIHTFTQYGYTFTQHVYTYTQEDVYTLYTSSIYSRHTDDNVVHAFFPATLFSNKNCKSINTHVCISICLFTDLFSLFGCLWLSLSPSFSLTLSLSRSLSPFHSPCSLSRIVYNSAYNSRESIQQNIRFAIVQTVCTTGICFIYDDDIVQTSFSATIYRYIRCAF